MKQLSAVLILSSLIACGHKPPPTIDPKSNPQEAVKPGQILGSALSIGLVADSQQSLVFLLTRLKTTSSNIELALSEEPTILLESDPSFSSARALISDYPAKQSYVVSSAEGSATANVAGVALTRANCDNGWAAYPLLALSQPIGAGEEVVIARSGEAASALLSRRLFDVSSAPPDAAKSKIEALSPPKKGRSQKLWSRLVELDGDSGAEIFVARLSYEPLANSSSRAALVEGFWLDEANGGWSLLEKQSREIAQEDLLSFSPESHWEQWVSAPILVVDLESDKIAEVVRRSLDGYSLWRVDGGKLSEISFSSLASEVKCE